MAVQQWRAKLLRWHQLTRYYTNKWQYDGAKWAERVWYGTGSKVPNAVASVPFMITRNMRAQLEQRGFPAHEISALLPKTAHELLNGKVSYAQFQATRAHYETVQQQEQQAAVDAAVDEIKEMVATIQARETNEEEQAAGLAVVPTPTGSTNESCTATEIALVPAPKEATETPERL